MTRAHRIRRRLARFGIEMLYINAQSRDPKVIARRERLVDQLIADAQLEVLLALQAGTLPIEVVEAHAREYGLAGAGLKAQLVLSQPLWDLVEATLPRMGRADATRLRYTLSSQQLRARLEGAESLRVRDLQTIDWEALLEVWPGGPSDWMHLRRFVSRFLSLVLGGKWHPMRHAILERIPTQQEAERVTDLTPAQFLTILEHAREDLRAPLMTLVLSGMRMGEYLACDETHLLPATHEIAVPGTKTKAAAGRVSIDPSLWHWVEFGVPSPVRYRQFVKLFKDAVVAAELPRTLRLHDLRHAHGQWAVAEGVPEAFVQVSLRHTQAATTRRYTKSGNLASVAKGLAGALNLSED
ncbi:MAG: tyrosine-type recombinase/integrase [Gemmatimonadaceae bacterium]|nr:tyrosine-type recombinase/integrase [Gemmatimonadaceae bacterium]